MVIDMAVLGAIGLAGGALSAGNHIVTNRRLRKLERESKFKNVEVSVLEFGLISSIGLQIADKISSKKLMKDLSMSNTQYADHLQSEINTLSTKIDSLNVAIMRVDAAQQKSGTSQITNVVDFVPEDDNKE
jgi:hypothetical protein